MLVQSKFIISASYLLNFSKQYFKVMVTIYGLLILIRYKIADIEKCLVYLCGISGRLFLILKVLIFRSIFLRVLEMIANNELGSAFKKPFFLCQ